MHAYCTVDESFDLLSVKLAHLSDNIFLIPLSISNTFYFGFLMQSLQIQKSSVKMFSDVKSLFLVLTVAAAMASAATSTYIRTGKCKVKHQYAFLIITKITQH